MCAFVFTKSMVIGVKSFICTYFLHEPNNCEKCQYRTLTTVKIKLHGEQSQPLPEQEANEEQEVVNSIRTLWLAPNVGIVKFKSEEKQISDEVKTLELKSYEIKPNNSENEENK